MTFMHHSISLLDVPREQFRIERWRRTAIGLELLLQC